MIVGANPPTFHNGNKMKIFKIIYQAEPGHKGGICFYAINENKAIKLFLKTVFSENGMRFKYLKSAIISIKEITE